MKTTTFLLWRLLPVLFLLLLLNGKGQAQKPAEDALFLPAKAALAVSNITDIALRSQAVGVNYALLDRLKPDTAAKIQIPLFANQTVEATLEKCIFRGPRDYTWFGTVPGVEDSSVQLTLYKDILLMRLALPGQGVFSTRRIAGGIHVLFERDPAKKGHCGGAIVPQNRGLPPVGVKPPAPPSGGGGIGAASVNTIDIIVFYTTQTKNAEGSASDVRTLAQASVDQTNDAFSDSNCNASLRLLDVRETTTFTENTSNYSAMLGQFDNDSITIYERDKQGADLCCLLVSDRQSNGGGSYTTGIGYVLQKPGGESSDPSAPPANLSAGFCVVSRKDSDDLTFAHEVGHNLGCGHSLNEDSHTGCYTFSHGYRFVANGSIRYYTVMAYGYTYLGFSATQVGRFSNPNDTYGSKAYGDSATADNARSIRITGSVVAGYREASLFVTKFAVGYQDGTNLYPYASVKTAVAAASSPSGSPVKVYVAGFGSSGYNETGFFSNKVRLLVWYGTFAQVGKP